MIRAVTRRVFFIVVVMALTASPLFAQADVQFENWKDAAPVRGPKAACRDLRALTDYTLSIDAATLVAPRQATPGFCQVTGLILPEVRFEVSLPARWNGRLYMFGNGGYAGENVPGRARVRDRALAAGFAVAQTNTGHDGEREPLASFAVHPQKLADYAYRAVHVTVLAAKHLARSYYGSAVEHAYFQGCSTGGRQGLIAAQRFPADFDGIVVGAPVLDFTGTMVHYAQMHRALRHAPGLLDKLGLIASRIYSKCDALDGLADGLIDDPRRCAFDPGADVPTCQPGGSVADCLAPAEIEALEAVYGPVVVDGATVYPGLPVGAEVATPSAGGTATGWQGWIVSPKPPTLTERFLETFFKYMVTPGREIDWRTFDPGKDLAQLQRIGTLLNATDADLRAFRARGGRILMYFGWAEPALNPVRGVQYFEEVQKVTGPSADFFRLFMLPGVFHCGGGPGPDALDTITPLVGWVERGVAPERLIAAKRQGEKTVRTRPLCPYPQVARYKGSGSIDDEGSFECRAPGPPDRSAPDRPGAR
jgi:Tannase and feruloyl esterase